MILRTCAVALCCSSASSRSRVRRATCVSRSGAGAPRPGAFGTLRGFGVTVLRRRVLGGSRPALERRLIASLKAQDHANCGAEWSDYSRDLRPAEWGPTVILRGNNLQDRMSALGQKRTLHQVRVMSALPPKADID